MRLAVRYFFLILFLFILSNQLLWINIIPYNFAPDEYAHYDVVEKYLTQKKYPLLIDNNAGIVKRDGNINASYVMLQPLPYIFSALLAFPFSASVNQHYWYLFARLGSAFSIILYSFSLIILIWIFTKDFNITLLGGIIGALIPQLSFIGAYVNSDSLTLALCTCLITYLSWLVKMKRFAFIYIIGLGILIGAVALTRYNAYPVLLTCILYFFYLFCIKIRKPKKYFLLLISIFFTCGWWFISNLVFYGDFFRLAEFYNTLRIVKPEEFKNISIWELLLKTDWLIVTFKSFIGAFDWNYIFLPTILYIIAFLIGLFGTIGFIFKIKRLNKFQKEIFTLFAFTSLFIFIQALLHSLLGSYQPQGRHLFPMYPMILLIIFLGFFFWRHKIQTFCLVALFTLFANFFSLYFIILPRYYHNSSSLKQIFFEIIYQKPLIFSKWIMLGIIICYILTFISLVGYIIYLFIFPYKNKKLLDV